MESLSGVGESDFEHSTAPRGLKWVRMGRFKARGQHQTAQPDWLQLLQSGGRGSRAALPEGPVWGHCLHGRNALGVGQDAGILPTLPPQQQIPFLEGILTFPNPLSFMFN